MPDFAYQVVDVRGKIRTGRLQAANENAARDQLNQQKYHIVAMSETAASTIPTTRNFMVRQPRMNSKQLTMFTRQLASLISVSPLEETLHNLARQNDAPKLQNILGNVHQAVVEGQRFSEALAREPASFSPLYRAMLATGESTGTLDSVAARMADLLERQARLRSKLIGALAYPVILALVAILVVAGLMAGVVPKVVEQFDNAKEQLPAITRFVMVISGFMANWWWAIGIGIVLCAFLGSQAMRFAGFRYAVDRMLLKLPIFGRLLRDVHAARIARTLATMVASRLPILEGLQLTGNTIRNSVLARANDQLIETVRTGGSLSGAMRATGVFPPVLVYLCASGEASGQLDIMLERAADYLEQQFEDSTSTALALLEPAIIVAMGGIVAVIILSILLPILQLQNLTGP